MRRARTAQVGAALLLPVLLGAAPVERDLGQGLVYVRVREFPGDLPAAAGRPPPCVVDLRYVAADEEKAPSLAAWLQARASSAAPVFVLANRDTAPALRQALRGMTPRAGAIVIGIRGPGFEPDLAVPSTPERERSAYDALDQGAALGALLTDHPDKVRNDEARLARAQGTTAREEGPAAGQPAPVVDATLQRAVHLHRSLGALKRP